jgi:adenosine deaminase
MRQALEAHDDSLAREQIIEDILEADREQTIEDILEATIDGGETAPHHAVAAHCFTRLEEIAEAEKELAAAKNRYRRWLETTAQQHGGEFSAAGYKASWLPATETTTYPVKRVKAWLTRHAGEEFTAGFVKECATTSVRAGSLRITKEK